MSGEPLPQSTQRDIKLLEKRLRDVELRLQALRVQSLEDLDDCQVLYDHPSQAPAEGNALIWDPDPSVVPFGGLWKPGNPFGAMPLLQWGGYDDHSAGVDIYAALTPEPPADGWYFATFTATVDTPLPADVCGWQFLGSVSSASSWFGTAGQVDHGLRRGVWTGSTGDSGTFGWQAALPTYPTPTVTAAALLQVDGTTAITAQASCSVWTLDDPGVSGSDFGAPTASFTNVDTLVNVSMIRIAPL